MNDLDRKVLENIDEFGCSVMHVAAEGELAPFCYSIGIQRTSAAPEVIVIGLKYELAHHVVNEYNRRVRAGERFEAGGRYEDFLGGFAVEAVSVQQAAYKEYFGYNLWLYKGPNFEAVQLVYPNTSGVWPWEPEADEWFQAWQPILGKR